jgi:hypothetical protein
MVRLDDSSERTQILSVFRGHGPVSERHRTHFGERLLIVLAAGDPFQGAEFTTSGTGTHLGRFTGEGFVTFFGTSDPDFPIFGEGEITFVAANGDELSAEFSGFIDTQGNAVIDFEITGGTGRFSHAEGSFEAEAQTISNNPPTFSFKANGRISF